MNRFFSAAREVIMRNPFFLSVVFILTVCLCNSRSDWTWLNPLPQGNDIRTIHGFNDHLVAAGGCGSVIEWDGSTWSHRDLPGIHAIRSLWCASATEWWTVTEDPSVWRFNGSTWTQVAFPYPDADINSIWAAGDGSVWMGGRLPSSWPGSPSIAFHFSGSDWTVHPIDNTFTIHQIWGLDASHVYAAGEEGVISMFDGHSWVSMPTGTNLWLHGIWGQSPIDLYTAGFNDDGEAGILHWDGVAWNAVLEESFSSLQFIAVSGIPGTGMAAISRNTVYTYDGSTLDTVTLMSNLNTIWGSPDGFVTGGPDGFLASDFSDEWIDLSSRVCSWVGSIVTGNSADMLFGSLNGTLINWNGTTLASIDTGMNHDILDMWGTSTTNAWLLTDIGRPAIYTWDGVQAVRSYQGDPQEDLTCLTGNASGAVFAGGVLYGGPDPIAALHRWNGSEWSSIDAASFSMILDICSPAPDQLFVIARSSDSDYYLAHWSGGSWSSWLLEDVDHAYSIWGSSVSDVIVGTDHSGIYHFDGTAVTAMHPGTMDDVSFRMLSGFGPDAVFASGETQTGTAVLLFWDGTRWSECAGPTEKRILSVGGSYPDHVFLAGESGVILTGSNSVPPYDHGAYLELNATFFRPNDPFTCAVRAVNGGSEHTLNAILYVVLDIGTGDYFFWPSWAHYPPSIDCNLLNLTPGETDRFTLFDFIWPETGASLSNLRFWTIMTSQEGNPIGDIDWVEWGFGL